MKCPFCGHPDTIVIDSRPSDDNARIRRRRECVECKKRFTTYETIETAPLMVIKKDGSRELFDKEKLLRSLLKACEKRSANIETLDAAVDKIEQALLNSMEREVTTEKIGELAMNELRQIDEVAYIRFASVYRRFKDVNTFMDEISKILN